MSAVTDPTGGEGPEQELRVLLERAVPQPAAPPQRLERVRERVRRRRRRRTAAVTGSTVLAFAAAFAVVPGLVGQGGGTAAPVVGATSGQRDGGRATVSPPTPGPTLPGTTSPTPASDGAFHPGSMAGLRLRSAGWRTLQDPATSSVFLSSQTLVLPQGGCAHALDGFCTPLARVLAEGGVLVMFHRETDKAQAGKFLRYEQPLADVEPVSSCRAVNGTRQLSRTMVGPVGSGTVVWATACLSHPSSARLDQVRDLLSSADFG